MKLEQLAEIALLNCGIAPDIPIVVGVSGGPDSLCLLDGLSRLGFAVIAAHFDHGLRPDSARDAEQVRALASRLNIPFTTDRQDAAAYARQERLTLEEAARMLRYRFLFDCARNTSAQAVAVGHTADDQVETVLMHLLRGTGLSGLTGMPYRSILPDWDASIPLVRPLLPFWREETLAHCQERGLSPLFDPSNQDTTFFRNRLRHELIPYLETYNPQVRQAVWRTAQILAGEASMLHAVVREAYARVLARSEAGCLGLDRPSFLSLDVGLRRGILRAAVAQLLTGEHEPVSSEALPAARDVDFSVIERALRWIATPGSGQIDLLQDLRLAVEGERIWFFRSQFLEPGDDWPQLSVDILDVPIPGEIVLSPRWRLVTAWKDRCDFPAFDRAHDPWEAWLDIADLNSPLALRRPRSGDRFQPLGLNSHSLKLSDFWINEKLPRRARQGYPLLICADALLWVPGFRPAHPYRIREHTRRALYVRLEHNE